MRVEMNMAWVVFALVLPLVAGLLVARPLWMNRVTDEIGSIAGAGVVLAFVVAFVAREYGEVLAITQRCIDANVGCRFQPQPFVRYGIYGAIGMGQIFLLFFAGLLVEEHLRERDRDAGARRSQ